MHLSQKIMVGLLLAFSALRGQEEDTLKHRRQFFLSDNKKKTALDSVVDRVVKPFMQSPQNYGISIGILKNGSSCFYNYGETQRDTRQLPSRSSIYEIGSISTTFCALLLAQAVAEHKIKLTEDIRTYLPGKYPNLAFDREPIQLKHLADHTSGLPVIPDDLTQQADFDSLKPYKNYNAKKIYSHLHTVQLTISPGDVCSYSNLGMALLGLILEKIYDKPFETLVKEKICTPNGMSNTGIRLEVPERQLASGYNQEGQSTPAWELGGFEAAGGLRSTAADLLSYLSYNLKENDDAVKLTHAPAFTGRQTVGLGWFIKKTAQGNTLLWQNGATYGFGSFCGFLKEKNGAVVVLCNSPVSVDYIAIAILNYLQR